MANETSGRRDNRVPFRASTKTPNIMMLRRTRLLLIVCGILAFAVLGIKLFSVMIIHHDEYEKMAIDQQVRETEITASRGAIYDTNGKILAMNASVDTIFISPAEIAKNNEDPQLIARELSEILDVDYDKILSMTKTPTAGMRSSSARSSRTCRKRCAPSKKRKSSSASRSSRIPSGTIPTAVCRARHRLCRAGQ